ncbi:MAG: Gfo/Idh/MocA family oxidoreductase [Acidobacteria bacterium]|nr:Gfo/Idh/MocA family oxidoreductase [Acidobacteriota bacterium]
MTVMERRYFLPTAVLGVTAARRAPAASDRIRIAVMGVRGRGRALTRDFLQLPEVDIACVCEVDDNVLSAAVKIVQEMRAKTPPVVRDIRKALDDRNLDAVVIATPDHWHAPATVLACAAGKDVYVEKPASHNLREGRLMVEAARRNGRIVQHGTQARSRASVRQAIEYAHSGQIGRVLMAKAWNVQLRADIGRRPDSPVPQGLDYDTWTGPAPLLPFNENRFHYKWHWHWNYGTGDIGNDGVHQIDIARWALGVGAPARVTGMGRKLFFEDDQQTPDTMNLTFEYSDKALVFEMRIWNPYGLEGADNAVAVYGSQGMVQIGDDVKIFDAKGKLVSHQKGTPAEHARNFVEAMRSRKPPHAEIEIGHLSSLHAHLGNIVARTGRALQFDPKTETITGDAEASRLLRREYRQHWSVPKGV